jgi:hypothetical protein
MKRGGDDKSVANKFKRAQLYAHTVRVSFAIFIIAIVWLNFVSFHSASIDNIPTSWLQTILPLAPLLAVVVSALAFIISSFGTASTIMLGWRSERRQSQEFKLRIEQLELQLIEARAKISSSSSADPSANIGSQI